MDRVIRTYSELCRYSTFEDRFNYLKLGSSVSSETFGSYRHFNQIFYTSAEWRRIRNIVIARDLGCDLGVDGFYLSKIYIHHMNPITLKDIDEMTEFLIDPEYLICCSFDTHNAIHYGSLDILNKYDFTERKPNDTCPWKGGY